MCLKKLEIQGFKSFGDRISLELHPGLTVIVGPNGSGKSNIADAISWCLGEQRPTTLRGSRMEDIIFAGSDKRKPVGMAEVTLTLDNSNQKFSLPYNEIAVTRRLYRSGESEYLINKVPCRLKDIQTLFMDTGLGRGAYSIIGQGKVDEVLSSRPEERRSVIEEAAGIVKYRHRKEEATRKLLSAQQDLVRISDLITELEDRIEPLAREAERAKEYNALQQEFNQLQLALLKRDWEDITRRESELKAQLVEAKSRLTGDKNILEPQLAAARTNLSEGERLLAEVKDKIHQLDNSLERVNSQQNLVAEQRQNLIAEKGRLENETVRLEDKSRVLEAELAEERDKLTVLEREMTAQASSNHEEQLGQLEQRIIELQQGLDNYNNELIEKLNLAANQRSKKNQAADRQNQLNLRLNNLLKQGEQLEHIVQTLSTEIGEAKEKLEEVKRENQETISRNSKLEDEIKLLNEQLLDVQRLHDITKEEMVVQESRLRVLDENLSSRSGLLRPVREILKASDINNSWLQGICGVVADIIRVPAGYETAIEAALGMALQNIITETSAQAKSCIDYLKRMNLGRVTFMPLDSLRPSFPGEQEKRALALDGVIGLASTIVQSEEKYRPAVELLLGRLIVVESLDKAIIVAKRMQQRVRLVTLSGELFHPGGTLSGGGPAKSAGGILHLRREKDELAEKVTLLRKQVQDISQDVAAKEEHKRILVNRLQKAQQELVALGLRLQAAEIELQQSIDSLQRARERTGESQWEIESIKQEQKHWNEMESVAARDLDLLERELEILQEGFATTQQWLRTAREEKNVLEKLVQEEKVRQAENRQESIGLQKIIQRLQSELQVNSTSAINIRDSLKGLEARNVEIQVRLEQLAAEYQKLQMERSQAEELYGIRLSEREGALLVVKELENQLSKLQEEWQETGQEVYNLELQLARIQTEHELLLVRFEELNIGEPSKMKVEPVSSKRQARHNLEELKRRIEAMGPVNAKAESEFLEATTRCNFLRSQQGDLQDSKATLESLISELNVMMAGQFTGAFKVINSNFERIFQQLFGGGSATMNLTEEDTLTCGIEITARPPGKKSQSLSLLSGGERALTAIALLFAILQYKPSPFCILDEIEASLDDANIKRFADYLSRTTDEVQFIAISHRKGTMERAQYLYGVTMDESGLTRLLSLALENNKGSKRLA